MIWFVFLTSFYSIVIGGEIPKIILDAKDYHGFPDKFELFVKTNDVLDPKFYWRHNGNLITSNYRPDFYRFNSKRLVPATKKPGKEDAYAGTYQFFMQTSVGTIAGRNVTVDFIYAGKFDKTSKKEDVRDVVIGQAGYIECPKHTPGNNFIYKWGVASSVGGTGTEFVKDDDHYIVLDDGTLFFSHVTNKTVQYFNSGSFRCGMEATEGASDTQVSQQLSWAQLPTQLKRVGENLTQFGPKIVTTLPHRRFQEGSSLYMKCAATGNPLPKYAWKKIDDDGTETDITPNTEYEFFKAMRLLSIKSAHRSHAGKYRCTATTGQKSDFVEGRLIFELEPKWVGSAPDEATPSIYSSLSWQCNATGFPEPTITWYVNGTKLSDGPDHRIADGRITFPRLKTEQSGMYQCVAKNTVNNIHRSVYLDVQAAKPVFKLNTGTETLFLNNDGIIKCHARAAPLAKNTWKKDGVIINLALSRYKLVHNEDLQITKVSKSDAGTYTCTAKNLFGDDEKTIQVKVVGEIKFISEPKDVNVTRNGKARLECQAEAEKHSLTSPIKYKWKVDGKDLSVKDSIIWAENNHALYFIDAQVGQSGVYECIAYIDKPSYAEKKRSARVIVRGPPEAPSDVKIQGNCYGLSATVSWNTNSKSFDPITHFIIQWSTSYKNVWHNLTGTVELNDNEKVVEPNDNEKVVEPLSPYAKYRFRVLASNKIGTSDPSKPTIYERCETPAAAPSKCPKVRGVPGKPDELTIKWEKMELIDQNGPGFQYLLQYRQTPDKPWQNKTFNAVTTEFAIPKAGYYQIWHFQIRGQNQNSSGKYCTGKSFSGQNAPSKAPENFAAKEWGSDFVSFVWNPIQLDPGSVDGYKLRYWQKDSDAKSRRSIVGDICSKKSPCEKTIVGGNRNSFDLDGLLAAVSYRFSLRGYNSGGDGPSSTITVTTNEGKPGSPSDLKAVAYAKFIKLEWDKPVAPNGIITGYSVSIRHRGKTLSSKKLGAGVKTFVFGNLEPKKKYKITIKARTEKGFGEDVSIEVTTKAPMRPARPDAPLVSGSGKGGVNVTFIEGAPPEGFPEKFLVLYRPKDYKGNLSRSDTQSLFGDDSSSSMFLDGLDTGVEYEFATVASNDFGESERSNFTIATAGEVIPPKARKSPIYKRSWFVAVAVVVCLLLLILLIALLITRKQGERYPVGKREKKRAGILDDAEEAEPDSYPMKPPRYNGNGLGRQHSGGSLPYRDPDRDSLDEYGEDRFGEDAGSLIGEYNDDKKPSAVEGPEFV